MRGYAKEPPASDEKPQGDMIMQVREYALITPLYGGGATPEAPDAVTTVRGTEVRGHLRFWWRACYGGYEKLEEMKRFEYALWGKAYEKGDKAPAFEKTVQIVVELSNSENVKPKAVDPYKISPSKKGGFRADPTNDIPGYASFPLKPESDELKQQDPPVVPPVYENVRFKLTISFPREKQREIEGTLWAWETFGGIGARTRRGFGSLQLKKIEEKDGDQYKELTLPVPPNSNEVKAWIGEQCKQHQIHGKAPGNTPFLSLTMDNIYVTQTYNNAKSAWNKLIEELSAFRQDRYENKFGPSKWPEAAAIRARKRRTNDKNDAAPPHKFPRAAFGLPLVFHFMKERDLEEATLQGQKEGFERLASPLILRPIMCKGGKAVGLAMLLGNAAPPAEKLLLKVKGDRQEYRVSALLNKQEAQKIEPLKGEVDALQAFMNYLERNNI